MYEIKATLPSTESVGDHIIDELVALFEAHGQDCTCGIANGAVIGYVEEDMLAKVTTLLLRYMPKVEVQVVAEEDELVPA
jgi:hypothetical protein